ncbi:MAG: radical SAM protein [Ezakiella sp.]|nr:radical SAM protein [Ezakiella sp.]
MKYLSIKKGYYLRDEGEFGICYNTDVKHCLDFVYTLDKIDFNILKIFNGCFTFDEIISIVNKSGFLSENIDDNFLNLFLKKHEMIIEHIEDRELRSVIIENKMTKNSNRLCFPIFASVRINNFCDSKCRYCFSNSNHTKNEFLDYEFIERMFEELYLGGVRSLNITGGDPFVHKDIFKILKLATSYDFNFQISTKKILSMEEINQLSESRVSHIQLSIDTYDDAINLINIGKEKYFFKQSKSISMLKKHGIDVEVNSVVFKDNISQLPEFLNILDDLGVTKISLTPLLTSAGRGDKVLPASEKEFIDLKNILNQSKLKYSSLDFVVPEKDINYSFYPYNTKLCSGGRLSIVVRSDAKITICERLMNDDRFIVGDYKKSTIKNIWDSEEMIKLVYPNQDNFNGCSCSCCENFQQCVLKHGLCYARVVETFDKMFHIDPFCFKSKNKNLFH